MRKVVPAGSTGILLLWSLFIAEVVAVSKTVEISRPAHLLTACLQYTRLPQEIGTRLGGHRPVQFSVVK
jgi:hypothetical protein